MSSTNKQPFQQKEIYFCLAYISSLVKQMKESLIYLDSFPQ